MRYKLSHYLCIFLLLNGMLLGALNCFMQKAGQDKKTELCKKSDSPKGEENDSENGEDSPEDSADEYLSIDYTLEWTQASAKLHFNQTLINYNSFKSSVKTPPPKIRA
jgi:hypothetical protein